MWPLRKLMPRATTIRAEIEMIADLIRLEEGWHRTKNSWWHPTGVKLWVANEDYGFGLWLDVDAGSACGPGNLSGYDGVELTKDEREYLWSLVGPPEPQLTIAPEAAAQVARRIVDRYSGDRSDAVADPNRSRGRTDR